MADTQDSIAATKPVRVAVTLGDPNGIGPEVVLKSLADDRMRRYVDPILIGSVHVLRQHAKTLDLALPELIPVADVAEPVQAPALKVFDPAPERDPRVALGEVTKNAGALAMAAVSEAVDLALNKVVEAVITAPISKKAIRKAGYQFPGHTEYLAERAKATSCRMMMVAGALRVALVTGHVALSAVAKRVTKTNIEQRLKTVVQSLRTDFGVERPRIAVLGLNPHAGEDGLMGPQEKKSIIPAIKVSCQKGTLAFGPFPADGFFGGGSYKEYDVILAMYHDQGLIPFKTLSFGCGVNYTAGLPFVRTSPDHGTAFDIAGRNRANEGSMRHALYLAADITRQRARLAS